MNIIRSITTLGPIGYARASGTLASIVFFPVVLALRYCLSGVSYCILMAVVIMSSYIFIHKSLCFFNRHDPHEIVLDECVGCFITVFLLPLNRNTIVTSFALFRFFDISKCFGIKRCESFAGAYGILFDDIVAGLFANVIIQIIIHRHQWLF